MSSTTPKDATERNGKGNQRDQTARNLTASAEGGGRVAQAATTPQTLRTPSAKADAVSSTASLRNTPPCYTCKVRIKIAVFFDGTGNNLDADMGTSEHSNVARLFRSHEPDDKNTGVYRAYVPGLGTYFKDIGDPGTDDGLAFGKFGEPRLRWAMEKIDSSIANHPLANITGIDISLFGFSRGAALARAFAIRVQGRCKQSAGGWMWGAGGFEARLYFMGLFDTVASVGLPASTSVNSGLIAKKFVTLDQGLIKRRRDSGNGLQPLDGNGNLGIAFGALPGADPTPGIMDGHGAWANNLRIPSMAVKCVHFASAHEMRNSFPLDSVREGNRSPSNAVEYWAPGVHSNVGGGYRPNEGGRSALPKDALSLTALIPMYDAALAAGVPLGGKTDPRSGADFEVSAELFRSFNNYIRVAERMANERHLEARLLTNRKIYFAWRFKRIREISGGQRLDGSIIQTEESAYAAERAQLDKDIAAATNKPSRLATQKNLAAAETEHANSRASYYALTRRDWVDQSKMQSALDRMRRTEAELASAKKSFADADDERLRLEARKTTLPGQGLAGAMTTYDSNLLLDVAAIQSVKRMYPRARLRPHYANLLEAYDAEFVNRKGLLDGEPDVLTFFDRYVHDSLAGFAKDETLPSDPRVIYIGGDAESRYAHNEGKSDATVA